MAAQSAAAPARWRRPFLTWLDGIEAGWAIPLLIVGFAAIWLLFLVIAYLSGDLHADVLETWSVGRSLAWGNAKHPPLMGWVAHLWTLVFPLADWSFQLLAMANAAVALWAVDLIARRFVRGDKRAILLLLLMLLPAYQFHAQRFNANTVLLAIWPLATYGFLRSFETRSVKWAAVAGALAAVAMLGKYYSVFLIGSFVLAAVCHPQRRLYFGSWAPWVSTLVGLIVLGPHLHWLATTGAAPIAHAIQAHVVHSLGPSLVEAAFFLLGIGATLILPAICWALMADRRLKKLRADFRALDCGLRLLFWICIGTIALPVIVTVAFGTDMPSLWALQGLFLVAVLVVCGSSYRIERFYTVNLAVMVIGIAVVAVTIVAPVHAIYRHANSPGDRNYYRLAAVELIRQWHQFTDVRLPGIGGDDALAFATAFYSDDHPPYDRELHNKYDGAMLRATGPEKGWAAMCFADDNGCLDWMRQVTVVVPHVRRFNFAVTPVLWGKAGKSATISALMVLPGAEAAGPPPAQPRGASDVGASQRR